MRSISIPRTSVVISRWTRPRSSGEILAARRSTLLTVRATAVRRILLDRGNGLLDLADLNGRHLIADELGFQLAEVIESSRAVDQLRIGDRIGRSGEQIGQTHLVPHVRWHHDQRGVEQAGHALEEIAQEGPFRTMSTRDTTYLAGETDDGPGSRRISGLPASLPCLCPDDSAMARAAYRNRWGTCRLASG